MEKSFSNNENSIKMENCSKSECDKAGSCLDKNIGDKKTEVRNVTKNQNEGLNVNEVVDNNSETTGNLSEKGEAKPDPALLAVDRDSGKEHSSVNKTAGKSKPKDSDKDVQTFVVSMLV